MIRRHRTGLAALALLLALSAPAAAEPTAEDKAAAESLFQDALKLIRESKHAEACPKLEASAKLDPAVGTLFNLGDCYEQTGRTASAWSSFGEAHRLAVRLGDRRAPDVKEREKALEPRLARLSVTAGDRPEGLVILRDKKPLDAALLGSAVPVDPGKHTLEAQAPGREPWSTDVDVPDRPGTVTVTIPALKPLGSGPAPSGSTPSDPGPDAPSGGMGTLRIVGLIGGVVGVAGLAAGGVLGGLAAGKVGESSEHCDGSTPARCDAVGLGLRRDALDLATFANVAFIAGGVLAASGAALFLFAPSPRGPAPAATVRLVPVAGPVSGVFVTGTF